MKWFLMLALSLCAIICVAQNDPVIMNCPVRYMDSPDGELIPPGTDPAPSKYFWVVYSDRDGNAAYDLPTETGQIRMKVNFSEPFYVTGESGDFLELYRWSDDADLKIKGSNGETLLNTKKAVRVGWIKKQHLLLWRTGITRASSGDMEKGLLSMHTEKGLNNVPIIAKPFFFYHPNLSETKSNNTKTLSDDLRNFKVVYIYKREGERILVGNRRRESQNDLLGWVDQHSLVSWNEKLYIEPNRDPKADQKRNDEVGNTAILFAGEKEAVSRAKGTNIQTAPLWEENLSGNRLSSNPVRFPVLKVKGDIIHTGLFTPTTIFGYAEPVDMFIPAYTSMNAKTSSVPVFSYVLHLSKDELTDLTDRFEQLLGEAPSNDQRDMVTDALVIMAQILSCKNNINPDQYALNELTPALKEIAFFNTPLCRMKINDIKNSQIISDQRLEEIRGKFIKSFQLLKGINKEMVSQSGKTVEVKDYWIPIDYLPN
jgi:hypothetical protein